MKKLILFTLLLFAVSQSFGQMYFDMITRYMIDTSYLYQKVREGIANNEQFCRQKDYLIYPIYQFNDTKPHTKEDYLNHSFLNTLTPLHRMSNSIITGSGWLTKCDRILIVDTQGEYMGHADTYSFCSYYKCECDDVMMINCDAALSDLLFNHVFDYIFATTEYYPWDDVRIYFGVNKRRKNVSLIFFTNYGIKIMPMEKVINEYGEDFHHETQELKKEIYNELKHSFDSTMKDISYEFCYF
ncbi:MAG: hypothetical protein IKM99_07405 [Bacteroidales bacterium]|nr:hypothetical protein [Bacteroidales bacterium]